MVDPQAWRQSTSAVTAASRAYRDAASSSGLLNAQQIRSVSEAEKYTQALQKQKLGLRDMIKHQGIMKEVYNDQLRMQRMTAQHWGTDTMGRQVTDITMPKNVPTELDNWRRKMGMFGNMAASAGTQVINLGKNMQWAGRQLTVGFTYPMVLFGAAAGVSAYKVEAAFGSINKVYDLNQESINNSAAKERELGQLRVDSMKLAENAAKKYGSSIDAVLAVEQELAATGIKGTKLLSSTDEVMRVSALGDIDPEQTTAMVVSLQTAFKDTIKDSGDLTNALNFMNAASNASSLSLQDIAEATPRAATSIAQMGGTVKDMVVVLTSMREAGINAAEGANAIKSAGTRIINPVPKAIDFYKNLGKNIKGAGIDIEDLSKKSGGNLLEFLKLLGKEQERIQVRDKETGKINEKETARMKARGVATLFGTYQNNRLTASLVNIADAYNGVENQTKKVMDLGAQTNQQLAKTADQSLGEMMNNPAGKFRQTFNALRVELAKMGEPFLEAAGNILGILGKIVKAFNGLDEGKKQFILLAAVLLALAGPAIMLTGLFFNLTGQFIKGAGALAKLVGISRLYTKEEKAAELTTAAVNKTLMAQATATGSVAAEMRALVASLEAGQKASAGFLETTAGGVPPLVSQGDAALGAARDVVAAEEMKQAAVKETAAVVQAENERMFAASQAAAKRGIYGEVAPKPVPRETVAPVVRNVTDFVGNERTIRDDAATKAAQTASDKTVANLNRENQLRSAAINKTNAQAAIQNKVTQSIGGGTLAMGAMGVAMAAMMVSSNKTVDNIAMWGMTAAIAVPAVTGLISGASAFGGKVKESVAALRTAQAGAIATSGAVGTMTAGAKGFGIALNAAMGPIGWITLGLTATVGLFAYFVNQNKKAAAEQAAVIAKQKAGQDALNSSASRWAESVGKAVNSYASLPNIVNGYSQQGASDMQKRIDYYKNEQVGEGQVKQVDAFNDLASDSQKAQAAVKMFADLQVEAGMSSEQAAKQMQAFFIATGRSAYRSEQLVGQLKNSLLDAGKINWAALLDNQVGQVESATVGNIRGRAEALAEVFVNSLSNAKTTEEAKAAMDKLARAAQAGFSNSMKNGSDGMKLWLDRAGIDSAKQLQNLFDQGRSAVLKSMTDSGALDSVGANAVYDELAASAGLYSKEISRAAGEALGLGNNIGNVRQIQDSFIAKSKTLTYKQQIAELRRLNNLIKNADNSVAGQAKALLGLGGGTKKARQEAAQYALSIFAAGRGTKQTGNYAKDLSNFMNDVSAEGGKAAGQARQVQQAIDGIHGKTVSINIKANQMGGIMQAGIEGVKEAIVDDATYNFDQQQQAAANALSASQEAQSRALQDAQESASNALSDRQEAESRALQERQEAATRAFEARWEKRKAALERLYDSRIKKIENISKAEQKADEVRQRLYEKEKQRLKDLAEGSNTQIDFDTAVNTGNLDEAAKIQNNANANNLSNQMDAETKRQEAITQRLIERLDKKRERLEKMRDRELKRLEKVEERMRLNLERIQEAQSRALQKQQEAQSRALERSQQAQSRALESRQQAETQAMQRSQELAKKEFDYKMKLFKALPAANKKQLREALQAAGIQLKDFGINVLDKKGGVADRWGSYFQEHLVKNMRLAGAQISQDNMWGQVSGDVAMRMLRGFGFSSIGAFQSFVRTGNLPKAKKEGESRHEGGVVGSGAGSRKGIPNSYRGLAPSEKMIRAQKGEFVVNKKQSERYRTVLENINSGRAEMHGSHAGFGGGVPAYSTMRPPRPGPTYAAYGQGPVAGGRMIQAGLKPAIADAVAAAKERARLAAQRRAAARRAAAAGGAGYTGPVTGLGNAAIQWALGQIGQYGWHGMCQSFVRQSFGAPGGFADATSAWYGARNKFSMAKGAPAGVPVYWTTGSHGHVVLSTGGGGAISTDHPVDDTANRTSIASVSSWLGAQPVGWTADINGKQIYPLRRGGTIRYDNTLISAHKGETVLPARLTEQFKDNVRTNNGGGETNITLDLRGAYIKEDVDIEQAVYKALDKRDAKIGRRKVVGG